MGFENYNGVLGEYLKECDLQDREPIYSFRYKYIKEIVWDDEKNIKYGDSRDGYEKFKHSNEYIRKDTSDSFYVVLKETEDKVTRESTGYTIETKSINLKNQDKLKELVSNAQLECMSLLGIKSPSFLFWLNGYSGYGGTYINSIDAARHKIKFLIGIIEDYAVQEDFKDFIDKFK